MKSAETMQAELDRLIEGHYYSEDYELEWAGKAYLDQCTGPERDVFEGLWVRRLTGQPGLADVAVCTRLGLPALTPYLAALLDREATSTAMSRALLNALSHQPDEQAYRSVERFMESEQEGEALSCLARMHFLRTLGHLRRAMKQAHLHNFCLHALHEYLRHAGMEHLLEAIRKLIEPDPEKLALHVKKILQSKEGAFNPFTDEELSLIWAILV